MALLDILEAKDVLTGELATIGEWTIAAVDTQIAWPVRAQKVTHQGTELWILPVMKDRQPSIAMKRSRGMNWQEAQTQIMRFASVLSWVKDAGLMVKVFSGGSRCSPMLRQDGPTSICSGLDLSYLPEPANDRAKLALALMREGRGLNHPAYAFLSFYKVLEAALPNGKQREKWIVDHIEKLRGHRAKEALKELIATNVGEIATHLYESGRKAIAHAQSEPLIDPDDTSDSRRLYAELPIIEDLAELAIEEVLGIETSHTVWQKHLYELDGFRRLFGPELVDVIARGEQTGERSVNLPTVHIELLDHDPYPPFRDLRPAYLEQNGQSVIVYFESENRQFGFRCRLDFPAERLHFDINADLLVNDDGTAEGAEAVAEAGRFVRDYWGNGSLRILDAETGALISRKDAFIPVNCWANVDAFNAGIAGWRQRAQERRGGAAA